MKFPSPFGFARRASCVAVCAGFGFFLSTMAVTVPLATADDKDETPSKEKPSKEDAPVETPERDEKAPPKPEAVKEKAAPSDPISVDANVPAFTIQDRSGGVFDSAQLAITEKGVKAHLLSVAIKAGADKASDLSLTLKSMKATKNEDGKDDDFSHWKFITSAVNHFGFQLTEEAAAEMKTLADVAKWVVARKDKPILMTQWGPRCPTCRNLNDRVIEFVQGTGVRLFALASNYKDREKHFAEFMEDYDFNVRVLVDRDQRVCDIFGGTNTPHFFLVDNKGVLRYKGAMDNDVRDVLEADEKKDYLRDAIAAVEAGKEVKVKETKPFG